MPSFSSKCLCCACSLTPVAICCGLIRCLLKLALWVSCLRSTAWGCRALGLAELNWTACPSPLLVLVAPLVKSALQLLALPPASCTGPSVPSASPWACPWCYLAALACSWGRFRPSLPSCSHTVPPCGEEPPPCSPGSLLLLLRSCLHLPTLPQMRVCKL